MADVIRQNLSEVGISVSLQPLERAALNQKGFIGEQFDMIVDSYAQGPDPDIGTERLYVTSNIHDPPLIFTNNSSYSNLEVDRLFAEQRLQTDPAGRKEIYDRIQEIIWDAVPILPIVAVTNVGAFRNTVMTNVFDAGDASKESFSRVELPATADGVSAAGHPAAPDPAGRSATSAIVAAGAVLAAAAGAWLLWQRRSRPADDDGLGET